jgi:hypothetical protein
MRLDRFHAFALETLPKAPEIQSAEPWDGGGAGGVRVAFASGAQLWIRTTMALAPGEKHDAPEAPFHGEPPAEVSFPELYEGGNVTPMRAKHYLAAALSNTGCDEISNVYPYQDDAHPGLGVRFHSGARVFLLFAHTARPGQSLSGTKYELQGTFQT